MGCSTNDVGNGGPTANVEYLQFCGGLVGLVEFMQFFQLELINLTHIRTVVCLQIVLRVKLFAVVLSEQNPFGKSVEM